MRRKLFVVLMCFVVALAFTACGGSSGPSPEEQSKEVTNNFMDALEDGDFEKAESYCSEDIQNKLNWDTLIEKAEEQITSEFTSSLSRQIPGFTLSDKMKDVVGDFVEDICGALIDSYTVKDAKKDGDAVKVTVEMKVPKQIGITNIDGYNLGYSSAKKYVEEHQTELEKIYREQGQNAYLNAVLEGTMPDALDQFIEKASSSEKETKTITITCGEENGEYKVTDVDPVLISELSL